MTISRLIAILQRVMDERGDVQVGIRDNDTDEILNIDMVGMTGDGRVIVYGHYRRDEEYIKWGEVLYPAKGGHSPAG